MIKSWILISKEKVNSSEKSYTQAVKETKGLNDKKLNIVIKGLAQGKNEGNNEQCLINKVNSLVRDGLKLSNVSVLKAERKNTSDSRPGIIIARL